MAHSYCKVFIQLFWPWTQLLTRPACLAEVGGLDSLQGRHIPVAQLVERDTDNVEVTGSNPVGTTMGM